MISEMRNTWMRLSTNDACASRTTPPQTPSYAQVREGIDGRSVFRHRHYRDRLRPVLNILAPVIAKLGYPDP
jgi:hypothetical protein